MVRFAVALREYWRVRGLFDEATLHLERVVEQIPEPASATERQALAGAAFFAYFRGNWERARTLGDRALAAFQDAGDRVWAARTEQMLAGTATSMGDFRRARRPLPGAAAFLRETEHWYGLALVLGSIAEASRRLGELDDARAAISEALSLRAEHGDETLYAFQLVVLAGIAADDGEHAEAAALIEESLPIAVELNDFNAIPANMFIAARVAAASGDPERAALLLGAAETALRRLGDGRYENEREEYFDPVAPMPHGRSAQTGGGASRHGPGAGAVRGGGARHGGRPSLSHRKPSARPLGRTRAEQADDGSGDGRQRLDAERGRGFGALGLVGRLEAEQAAERRAEGEAERAGATRGGRADERRRSGGFAMTASRSGFGIPFLFTLPSSASENIVSISCSKPSAGCTSQTKCAVSSPTLRKRCGVPAGTSERSPGFATSVRLPSRNSSSPARTSKRSSCAGWTCAAATAPFGSTNVSTTTGSPFVSADVVRKTRVSPVTRFVMDWPVVIISVLHGAGELDAHTIGRAA